MRQWRSWFKIILRVDTSNSTTDTGVTDEPALSAKPGLSSLWSDIADFHPKILNIWKSFKKVFEKVQCILLTNYSWNCSGMDFSSNSCHTKLRNDCVLLNCEIILFHCIEKWLCSIILWNDCVPLNCELRNDCVPTKLRNDCVPLNCELRNDCVPTKLRNDCVPNWEMTVFQRNWEMTVFH